MVETTHLTPGLKERVLGAERETAGRRRHIYEEARRVQRATIARLGRDLEDLAWFYDVGVHFSRPRSTTRWDFPTAMEASMPHGRRSYMDLVTPESVASTRAEILKVRQQLLDVVAKVDAIEAALTSWSYVSSSPPTTRSRRVDFTGRVSYEEDQ